MAISVRGSGDTSKMNKKNGVGTGNTQLENLTVSGTMTVATPVNDTDAATKKYVDDALEDVIYGEGEGSIEEVVNSVLPTVTAEDNDKVLTVVNGVWDKADLPESEDEIFIVTQQTDIEQLLTDYWENKKYKTLIYAETDSSGNYTCGLPLVDAYNDGATLFFEFASIEQTFNQGIHIKYAEWSSTNEGNGWNTINKPFYTVPQTSTSDVNKVPMVNTSGEYELTTLEIPEITIDTALSTTSENPVQNKVINEALNSLTLTATDDGDGNVTLFIQGGGTNG